MGQGLKIFILLAFIAFFASPSTSFCDSEIYTYKDDTGRTRYVNDPANIPSQYRDKNLKPHALPNIFKLKDMHGLRDSNEPQPVEVSKKKIEMTEEYLSLFDPVEQTPEELAASATPQQREELQFEKDKEEAMKVINFLKIWWPVFAAIILLQIISMWKLLVRADLPGYSLFIPIYNLVVMSRLGGKSGWWVIWLCIPIIGGLVWSCTVYWGIAQRFNAGAGVSIGTVVLPIVFIPILAFDKRYA